MTKIYQALFLLLYCQTGICFGQIDTLKIELKEAESLFLRNNYDLIAGHYQIEQAKAEIITAKLFNNPELSYENLFYNQETGKFLQTSNRSGQYTASISQLIQLAGKRKKNISLAKSGNEVAEQEYFDLLRSLKFQLRNTFYQLYYQQQSQKVYQDQISATQQLLTIYEAQFKNGNLALKDVLRIKSLLISLKSELISLCNELEDNQKELKLLCGLEASRPVQLVFKPEDLIPIANIPYAALLDSAKANRTDIRLAQTSLQYEQDNLKLQQAMAVPDLEVSLNYDLKGNYPEKYTGLGIRLPIPLFNRNQGEIKKALIGIDIAENQLRKQEALLENEVFNTYKMAIRTENLDKEIDPTFGPDFGKLISGVTQSLKDRSISLIEFLDMYDSYRENILHINLLEYKKMSSREELNYVTGSNIFN